eukprot:g3020.t1
MEGSPQAPPPKAPRKTRHEVQFCGSIHVNSLSNTVQSVWTACYAEMRGPVLSWWPAHAPRRDARGTPVPPLGRRAVRLEPPTRVECCTADALHPHALRLLTEARDPNDELPPLVLAVDTAATLGLWLDALEGARLALQHELTVRLPLARCRFLDETSQLPVDGVGRGKAERLAPAATLDLDTVAVPPTLAMLPHIAPCELADVAQPSLWRERRAFIFYWRRTAHGTKPLYVDARFSEEEWGAASRALRVQFARAGAALREDKTSRTAQAFWARLEAEVRAGQPPRFELGE